MRTLLFVLSATALLTTAKAAPAAESPASIALWENGAPGSEERKNEPETISGTKITNVHNPS